ncbi:MAG: hypothetical protein ACH346_04865, partial [Chthoniobacterales bacterium]
SFFLIIICAEVSALSWSFSPSFGFLGFLGRHFFFFVIVQQSGKMKNGATKKRKLFKNKSFCDCSFFAAPFLGGFWL